MTDPYAQPGGTCLRNKLGITDAFVLATAEARIVAARDVQLARDTLPGEYNLEHLLRFHAALFGDVYDWAGELRRVEIAKDGLRFCGWRYLAEELSAVLNRLAEDRWLIGLTRPVFVDRLAHYYGEMNARHPFREGNGRTQRAFLRQLAAAAGWRLDWSALSRADNVAASRHNLVTAEHGELLRVFGPVVTRL